MAERTPGLKDELLRRARPVEAYLETCLADDAFPPALREAMQYSLLGGGKRLRPVLLITWARMLGTHPDAVMPFAAALELIHTYSLVHDDLPAMDDDELRRGKPSNHAAFGEATAILAGDGLLTEAFGLMCRTQAPPALVVRAVALAARAAGAAGMVGGQVLDMAYTGAANGVDLPALRAMHAMKTGALITMACEAGAVLADADERAIADAREYGRAVGVAFQIADDVLDVVGDEAALGKPVGSDEAHGKTTYPALVGLDESRRLAYEHADAAVHRLERRTGEDRDFLAALARYIVERTD